MGGGMLLLLSLIIVSFQVAQSCSVLSVLTLNKLRWSNVGNRGVEVPIVGAKPHASSTCLFPSARTSKVRRTYRAILISSIRGSNRAQYSPRQVQRRNPRHSTRRRR